MFSIKIKSVHYKKYERNGLTRCSRWKSKVLTLQKVWEKFGDELNCHSTHQSLSLRTLVMNWTVIPYINHCHKELWWWIELSFYPSINVIKNFGDELNCHSIHQSLSLRTLVMNWTVILYINHCHKEHWWWIELSFYTSITVIKNFGDELNCHSTHQSLS